MSSFGPTSSLISDVRTSAALLLLPLALASAGVARAQVITPSPDPNHAILGAPMQSWADGLMNTPLTAGNQTTLLECGVRSFPEKLRLINGATQDVFFTTMICGWDTTGRQLAQALVAAALRGVKVRAIVDGQRCDPRFVAFVRAGGVDCKLFNRLFVKDGRAHRFHQKLLVADLRTMVCGGMNSTDSYHLGDGHNDYYKDTDALVAGDVAASASMVFLGQWLELAPNDLAARALLASAASWGPLAVTGGPTARVGHARWLVQENDRGSEVIRDYYVRCFQEARRQVVWHVNNLIPTDELTTALSGAVSRGVRVILLTNSRRANARRQGAFLGWFQTVFQRVMMRRLNGTGIEIWEQDVPLHSKALTVDGVMASVGSYNFSSSSENNLEATCVSYDPAFVTEVEAMFDRDLSAARRIR